MLNHILAVRGPIILQVRQVVRRSRKGEIGTICDHTLRRRLGNLQIGRRMTIKRPADGVRRRNVPRLVDRPDGHLILSVILVPEGPAKRLPRRRGGLTASQLPINRERRKHIAGLGLKRIIRIRRKGAIFRETRIRELRHRRRRLVIDPPKRVRRRNIAQPVRRVDRHRVRALAHRTLVVGRRVVLHLITVQRPVEVEFRHIFRLCEGIEVKRALVCKRLFLRRARNLRLERLRHKVECRRRQQSAVPILAGNCHPVGRAGRQSALYCKLARDADLVVRREIVKRLFCPFLPINQDLHLRKQVRAVSMHRKPNPIRRRLRLTDQSQRITSDSERIRTQILGNAICALNDPAALIVDSRVVREVALLKHFRLIRATILGIVANCRVIRHRIAHQERAKRCFRLSRTCSRGEVVSQSAIGKGKRNDLRNTILLNMQIRRNTGDFSGCLWQHIKHKLHVLPILRRLNRPHKVHRQCHILEGNSKVVDSNTRRCRAVRITKKTKPYLL